MEHSQALSDVVEQAERYAVESGREVIGTPYAFAALLSISGTALRRALKNQSCDIDSLIEFLLRGMGTGDGARKPTITHRLHNNLRHAEDIARLALAKEVHVDHLSEAILCEHDGFTLDCLKKAGIDKDRLLRDMKQGTNSTPILEKLARNLTQLAHRNQLEPVIGRDPEIQQITRTLLRKNKGNPLLIGPAGVGKTAVVEGVAQFLASDHCPIQLNATMIFELSVASLVAGTTYRGQFEERMLGVIEELKSIPESVLFIDEIHTLLHAGSVHGGALDAGNILKPALARGEIRCIGATTEDEYQQYIQQDPALERRFNPIRIDEPSPHATLKILQGVKGRYESHHGVFIKEDALYVIVSLSEKHIPERRFPDKALDLLDEACTRAVLPSGQFDFGQPDVGKSAFDSFAGMSEGFQQQPSDDMGPVVTVEIVVRTLEDRLGRRISVTGMAQ